MNINDEIRPQYITLYNSYVIGSCVKSWPDLMTKQNWYTKTFPQEYDLELLDPKQNENSDHNSKGADAVKPI